MGFGEYRAVKWWFVHALPVYSCSRKNMKSDVVGELFTKFLTSCSLVEKRIKILHIFAYNCFY